MVLQKKIAALEGTDEAMIFSRGSAAVAAQWKHDDPDATHTSAGLVEDGSKYNRSYRIFRKSFEIWFTFLPTHQKIGSTRADS